MCLTRTRETVTNVGVDLFLIRDGRSGPRFVAMTDAVADAQL